MWFAFISTSIPIYLKILSAMEFTSSDDRRRVKSTLEQIRIAIGQLKEWNEEVNSPIDYYLSSSGMQKLAASCMLIEAVG